MYDIIAKARVGEYEDFRKVRVNCVNKDQVYRQTVEEDRKTRGVEGIPELIQEDVNLDEVRMDFFQSQEDFFEYLPHDLERATSIVTETLEKLEKYLPVFPDDLWLQNIHAYTFKNYAMVMRASHNYEEFSRGLSESEKIFKAIRDQDPNDAGAWNGLGSVAGLRGDYQKALEYIDKALEINPNYTAAHHDRGIILEYIRHQASRQKSSRTND
jgi:tetratricopeptide (TPR) repeat protein